jgi:hypothetical protein
LCSHGHFNHPAAVFCSVCGISMNQATMDLVDGQPPPLGVMVVDDGTTFALDADYVVGRAPGGDWRVAAGEARPFVLNDQGGMVSRVHLHLLLDGWHVLAVDRGSTNGTLVAAPGDDDWTPLPPHRPTRLAPGTQLLVGCRTLLFQACPGIG